MLGGGVLAGGERALQLGAEHTVYAMLGAVGGELGAQAVHPGAGLGAHLGGLRGGGDEALEVGLFADQGVADLVGLDAGALFVLLGLGEAGA